MNNLATWFDSYGKLATMILAFMGWVVAGVLAWNNIQWRVKNLETWKKEAVETFSELKDIVAVQVKITRDVELNSVKLGEIAKNTERRLQLCEDRSK